MAAPRKNQFWKQRSKHGRDRLFETPNLLLEAAYEYFDWSVKNPLIETVHDKLKVNGFGDKLTMVKLPKMRPFTLMGLCIYLDCNSAYFRQFKDTLKDKEDDLSKDFSTVITHIEEVIYTQKFEGAAVGMLNANIISRDLGLIDKTDLTTDGEKIKTIPLVLSDGRSYEDLIKELKKE